MENKILTISIAAYNVEEYIRDTLESLIVSDILKDMEVLVINDGSTDSTPSIVEEYAKKYPDVFKLINKKNGGYGSTINTAIKHATGKYFKQLDGDDWFDKENLSEFIVFLKSSAADCIYSPYWKVYQDIEKRELIELYNLKENLITDRDISMYTFTFKTSIFIEKGIKISEQRFYTDTEYSLKPLFFVDTIDYFHSPVYCYRLGRVGQSVSKEGWKKHYKNYNDLALEMMQYYEQNKKRMSLKNKGIIEKYISSIHKANLYVALEIKDNEVQRQYKQLDLAVKKLFPEFYEKKNLKMAILAYSNYKLWGITRLFHKLFEKNMII